MNKQEINRKFAELAGICWHEIVREPYVCSCGAYCETERTAYWHIHNDNPDFCADPRLVLEVMMKREDWPEFMRSLQIVDNPCLFLQKYTEDYILDTTGLLALKAIEWMEAHK